MHSVISSDSQLEFDLHCDSTTTFQKHLESETGLRCSSHSKTASPKKWSSTTECVADFLKTTD